MLHAFSQDNPVIFDVCLNGWALHELVAIQLDQVKPFSAVNFALTGS